MPLDRRIIVCALQAKGFKRIEKKHHTYYYLYHEGKKMPVSTRISRGSGHSEYSDNLLYKIRYQLNFNSKKQLYDFFGCPFTKTQYIGLLKEKKVIG